MPNLNSRLKLRRDTILFSPDRTSRCPQISPQGTPHPLAPSPPEGRGGGSFIVPVGSASQTGPPGARKEPLTPWPPLPRRGEGGFPSLSRSALRVRPGHPAPGIPHPLAPSPPEGRGGGSFIVPVGTSSQTGAPAVRLPGAFCARSKRDASSALLGGDPHAYFWYDSGDSAVMPYGEQRRVRCT